MPKELASYRRLVSIYYRVVVAAPWAQTLAGIYMTDYMRFFAVSFAFLERVGQPAQLSQWVGRVYDEPKILFGAIVGI